MSTIQFDLEKQSTTTEFEVRVQHTIDSAYIRAAMEVEKICEELQLYLTDTQKLFLRHKLVSFSLNEQLIEYKRTEL